MTRTKMPVMAAGLALCGLWTTAVAAGEIQWRSGTVQTTFRGAAGAAADLAALAPQRGGAAARHIVVQFDRPVTDEERATLAASGVQLQDYLGRHAYFAVVSGSVDAARLGQVQALQVALPVDPVWKLHPTLARDEVMPWAVVSERPKDAESVTAADNPTVAAYVLFHRDVALEAVGVALVQAHRGAVRSYLRSINGLVVELPYAQIRLLAAEDAVACVEPPLPALAGVNDSNRERTGADVAQAAPYNLNGAGVDVLVYDGGSVKADHSDLVGRVRLGDTAALSDHSTHVAGTVGGDGAQSAGLRRGMAPGVQIHSYGFETGGPLEAGFLYTDPGDIEADYTDAINNWGADIANNSIGTNTAPNGFPCDWEGDYGATSALIDAIVRGSLGAPFRIVWANGNERQVTRCGTTYHTTAPPACAKNHLTVGALNSNDDSITTFTSWGPTDDGRIKPDVSGPGCQVGSDNGVTSCSSSGAYAAKCGTSMASPTVCGLGALLLQDYRAYYPAEPDFRNSTLRALLAHTAVDLGNAGPDYQVGYGSVRVVPAIDQLRSGNWLEGEVGQGDTYQVLVLVDAGDPELRVTIAWDDAPSAPVALGALVNDLDLLVTDVSSNSYYPWTLDPLNPSNPAVRTQADRVNNIEQVVINAPAPGTYLVSVSGYNIPQGPQSFSLIASPYLVDCSPKGQIKLDRTSYPCGSTLAIVVKDCDLNTNDSVVEQTVITVASTSEPAGEAVTLTETGAQTGEFTGTLGTAAADTNGVLLTTAGDTITATYVDADDGLGGINVVVTDTAIVDCSASLVSNVAVVDIDPRSARITFDTNEPAQVEIAYGTNCGALTDTAGAFGLNLTHSVNLSQLQDNTTYYFEIRATDAAGNLTVDNQGGACYTFATPEIPDYFTELFTTDFDLDNTGILFAPNSSVDFYAACSFSTLALPTDPTGGTPLTLGDTSSATVNLTGGAQVLLYGTAYSTLYVNANGNITLDLADSDTTETIADHFDQVRVSALFDDLDPSEGGTVSYRQLGDRIAVTWQNVPQDALGDANTFQIELFFDGRIQVTWLDVAATDGLAGLSAGGGQPIDFFETDLSALAGCGPRPPSAAGKTYAVGQDREATLTLLASDDGVPGPLTYLIVSLPTQELRDAGNGHIITGGELPYTLVSGGNQVVYASTNGFVGPDSFTFKANDGGTPPDAGDSNIATAVVDVGPVLSIPIFDSFPTTTFDPGLWDEVFNATIDGVGIDEPSPPNAARLNGNPSGVDRITTHLIDLSSATGVRLAYGWQRRGGGESPDAGDNLVVEYLNTNGEWVTAAEYAGDGPDDTVFNMESIFLPAAALHDSFRLRFRAKGTAGAFDDWFVDDVVLAPADAPLAESISVTTGQGTVRDITLPATDPNMDPLDYVIVTYPTNGTLTDPNAGPISSNGLPYTLVTGGNVVQYAPDAGFAGTDAFDFKATDGTYESNVATVTVFIEPVLSIPFVDEFPTTTFNELKWKVVDTATIDDVGLAEPTPPYAARINGHPDGVDSIETYAIDLNGLSEVHLQYAWQRRGGGDSPEAGDNLNVEYVPIGGGWASLAVHLGADADMTTFAAADIALPANALHPDFRLRFRATGTASTTIFDDWFVDDVHIIQLNTPTAFDDTVTVAKYGAADIVLIASDPNDDPLTYIVQSLPASGELRDAGTGTTITPGDLPYALAGGSNALYYLTQLGVVGNLAFQFVATDGENISAAATVALEIGGEATFYSFPLDADPGWTTEGAWAFGVPLGVNFDPTTGHTGPNVYGYNLAGSYTNGLPATYLTTPALDFTGVHDAFLNFYRWLGVEDAQYDHASVEMSVNGTTWSPVWEHTGTTLVEVAWTLQSYDVSALADGQPTVYFRWGMGPTDGGVVFGGWNLDDLSITGSFVPSLADIDGDTDTDLVDYRAFAACLAGPQTPPTPPTPMPVGDCLAAFDFDTDGDVDLGDFAEFQDATGQ